jgi:hypothetical protein
VLGGILQLFLQGLILFVLGTGVAVSREGIFFLAVELTLPILEQATRYTEGVRDLGERLSLPCRTISTASFLNWGVNVLRTPADLRCAMGTPL